MNNDVSSRARIGTGGAGSVVALLRGIFACVVLLQAVPAAAEEEAFPDRFSLRMGGYRVQNADALIRKDNNNAPVGAYIDFHDTLGGETSATVLRADGLYRFNDRHAVGFSWYSIKFDGSTVLGKDITWGDQVIVQGKHVESMLKFDVVKANYQYSLFHNEKAELGGIIGLHVLKLAIQINATSQSYYEAVTAPLPVFGVFANYHFDPRFSVFYNYQFFFINYDNTIKGGIQDMLIGLEYRVSTHLALGAAYNRFAMSIENKKDSTTVSADSSWNGGLLYAGIFF